MRGLSEILARSAGGEGGAHRAAMILEWASAVLRAEGIALFLAPGGRPGAWETRLASGTLAAAAPLLAAELSRTGVPSAPALLPLTEGGTSFLCWPVNVDDGTTWSAVVIQGRALEEAIAAHPEDLAEATAALRAVLSGEPTMVPAPEAAGKTSKQAPEPHRFPGEALRNLLPSLPVLTEGLRLPLYTCDREGAFTYASSAFLSLTGYGSLEALKARNDVFPEAEQRAGEMAALQRQGKVESFPLVVRSGTGARLSIRDSAVLLGDSIFGVFFDVTGLVSANAELKDALQIQELLNDSILAGASLLQRTQGAAIRSLARLAEYRDPETGFHLQRICEYTRLLALEVHLRAPYTFRITREYANDISLSSMLHDVGKVSIPDHILLKPGKLDPDEWEVMKKHTVFGWEVLHKADRELGEQSFLTLAASIALSHHERFDGGGYPRGTGGQGIPLSARIVAIADAYDALSSRRPYKEAWPHERAVEEIRTQAGGHFDPVLVSIFSDLLPQFAEVRQRYPG